MLLSHRVVNGRYGKGCAGGMIRELQLRPVMKASVTVPLRILIPAHNESARIAPMLEDYCTHFSNLGVVMVIANACGDDTVALVRRLMERYDNLQLVEIDARIGKGGAIRAGLKIGEEPYVGFADADGSTSAAEFNRLFNECVQRGTAGVIGSRWLPGAEVSPRQPLLRRCASRAFNVFVRALFDIPFADTQCGAKIFRREAVNEILPSLEVADFAFDIDLLFHLARRGVDVCEVPTRWADRAAGTNVRLMSTSWTMLKSVLRLRLHESWFWRVPFADLLARDSVIPVTKATRLLALCPNDADTWGMACLESLELSGVVVDRRRFRNALSMLFWYAVCSDRKYDAIVEVRGRDAALIPLLSAKHCFLVGDSRSGNPVTRFIHRRLYGRSHIVVRSSKAAAAFSPLFGNQQLEGSDPKSVAKYIIAQIGACGLYRAAFRMGSSGWELHFNDGNRSGASTRPSK